LHLIGVSILGPQFAKTDFDLVDFGSDRIEGLDQNFGSSFLLQLWAFRPLIEFLFFRELLLDPFLWIVDL